MDGIDNLRVDSHAHHQQNAPTVDDRRVKDFEMATLNNLCQLAAATTNPQLFGQQVFGSQRTHGDGNTGMSIHKIGHGPITASGDDA